MVSWGIKISNLQPELTATGRIIISHVPIGDTVPAYTNLSSTAIAPGSQILTPITGMSPAVLMSSNTLELPTAIELSV